MGLSLATLSTLNLGQRALLDLNGRLWSQNVIHSCQMFIHIAAKINVFGIYLHPHEGPQNVLKAQHVCFPLCMSFSKADAADDDDCLAPLVNIFDTGTLSMACQQRK